MKELPNGWFARDATEVARDLLGKTLRFGECAGVIVETEAYTDDAASHGRTLTERSRLMHETHGHWYVYFTYGMHYCVNVTTNEGAVGAVLIRAIEPTEGIELMKERRGTEKLLNLCSGPGKLCKAFGITKEQNGLPIEAPFTIFDAPSISDRDIVIDTRIGITRAAELPWRFSLRGNPHVSR